LTPNAIRERQTYASQGDEASVSPLLPRARRLEYREGALLYRDIYFGFRHFVGQGIVYYDSSPIWAMGYAGGILPTEVDAAELYEFLRLALQQVTPERPYRRPRLLRSRPYLYRDVTHGRVERFWGIETITRGGHVVHRLRYHGGMLCCPGLTGCWGAGGASLDTVPTGEVHPMQETC